MTEFSMPGVLPEAARLPIQVMVLDLHSSYLQEHLTRHLNAIEEAGGQIVEAHCVSAPPDRATDYTIIVLYRAAQPVEPPVTEGAFSGWVPAHYRTVQAPSAAGEPAVGPESNPSTT